VKEEETIRRKERRKGSKRNTKLKIKKEERKSGLGVWSCFQQNNGHYKPSRILSDLWKSGFQANV